ncbi:MAG: hypothetical protein Q9179_003399 [Wetmoreana sp. 5 TL-2023]
MISYRAYRDIEKCEKKYGEAWQEYKRQVPYLFIPHTPDPSDTSLGQSLIKSTGIFLFHPKLPNYPQARFPGVVVFSEIYQAGHGYIVAAPSSYHEFTGPEPLAYDTPGTDKGNAYKIRKVNIHSHSLGQGKDDDSLQKAGDIKGEIIMIHGKSDPHVPSSGRDLIRNTLHGKGVEFSFYEIAGAQHAFIRDELSKGRYDPHISRICFEMLLELFERTLRSDLGPRAGGKEEGEDIC